MGWGLVARSPAPAPVEFHEAEGVFPALTCTVQASFRTAAPPSEHGMVANGLYHRDLMKPLFWEQSANLVQGPRFWERPPAGRRVGMLFWQQSLGERLDLVLSPKPVHKHGGGMIQDCYSQPVDLYAKLCARVGRRFNLMHYWGPLASGKSSDWIVAGTAAVMASPELAPDLLLTYVPHLDYALQRCGPSSPEAERALARVYDYLGQLRRSAEAHGYDYLFFGDYAMEEVPGGPVFPNRALREAGLFRVRPVNGRAYPDHYASRAFAMVDHQIAHVFADAAALDRAAGVLRALPGVEDVLDRDAQRARGIGHARSGELVLVAAAGRWFAYPWWENRREAPDYATHVDIHNKPGYDPCELFFGRTPFSVSLDARRVKGSHGRTNPGTSVAWATSCPFDHQPTTLVDLAQAAAAWLEG
jgi:predicted AlkP superfamily pyrophosphatase or phosphodiesterase